MKVIKYRRTFAFFKLCLSFCLVLISFILCMVATFPDTSLINRIYMGSTGILGFLFFSRYSFLLLFLAFNPTSFLFSYNDQKIQTRKEQIMWSQVIKIGNGTTKTGFLGTDSPAFVFYCQDGTQVYIPTYRLLSEKEYFSIMQSLRNCITQKQFIKL